jgi:hypothetical protein
MVFIVVQTLFLYLRVLVGTELEECFFIAIVVSNSSFPRMAFWAPPSVPPFVRPAEQTWKVDLLSCY